QPERAEPKGPADRPPALLIDDRDHREPEKRVARRAVRRRRTPDTAPYKRTVDVAHGEGADREQHQHHGEAEQGERRARIDGASFEERRASIEEVRSEEHTSE